MPKEYPRRVANLLLRSAVWIAPHDMFEWGQAMLSELSYVKGDWAALIWAIGGAGFLAKHAFLFFFIPGGRRRNVSFTEGIFVKEGPMRKIPLAAVGACALASLLFFLVPAFRQAFRVSLASWDSVVHVMSPNQQPNPELKVLARRAEQNHDAEGLAFVAVRHSDTGESARLAEEAVHLDPKLTWVYAVIAVRQSDLPQMDEWVSELEQWDPQNALPHFINAERIDIDQVIREKIPQQVDQESRAWQEAMAAAFGSPRLDNYHDRLKELDRRVLLHYGLNDPYQAIGQECWYGLPSYTAWDSSRYAQSILESGEKLEVQGNRRGAVEKYWAVARFGQMVGSAGGFMMRRVVRDTYKKLGTLSEKEGRNEEAKFYASLGAQINNAQLEEDTAIKNRFRGGDVSSWNAFLARASGLMMLFSGGLLLTCALTVIARGRSLRLGSLRPGRLNLGLGLGGAIGSLLSSAMLYVSYRPYAEILQRFIRTGDDSRIPELSQFLAHAQIPLGAEQFKHLPDFVFYFWVGVSVLCMVALVLALVCRFWGRPRATAT
jgi:hypothetical protein